MSQTLHGTSVAVGEAGLLILGPSGAGKSDLALGMIALGARLISDDQTHIRLEDEGLIASCPSPAHRGLIEARGLGILQVPSVIMAKLQLILDLSQQEPHRFPAKRNLVLLGHKVDLVLRPQSEHLAFVMMLMMKEGRITPDP